jgi:5-methylcytosine-specific restriction endonuclease McrA
VPIGTYKALIVIFFIYYLYDYYKLLRVRTREGGSYEVRIGYRRAVKLIGEPDKCAICGKPFPEEYKKPMTSSHEKPNQPTIDHKIPRSKGGTDEAKNLQWVDYKCNQDKGDK